MLATLTWIDFGVIATAAIAIGMIVMIIAVATGVGLQKKIREKVSAFNGDITISLFDRNNSITTVKPISINQDFYPDFSSVSQVSHVQAVVTKGAMIRTATDFEGVILNRDALIKSKNKSLFCW